MNELVRITPKDSVAVALTALPAGTVAHYEGGSVTLLSDLPMGHKAALRDIAKGEAVIKYGFPIGQATEDIPAGAPIFQKTDGTCEAFDIDYPQPFEAFLGFAVRVPDKTPDTPVTRPNQENPLAVWRPDEIIEVLGDKFQLING